MDEIWPHHNKNVDPAELYELSFFDSDRGAENNEPGGKPAQKKHPWLVLNMVSSLDGSAASQGTSGRLGTPEDKLIFNSLRAGADFILAGANTVRQEKYGMPKINEEAKKRRAARGQKSLPRLVIISGSLAFDEDSRFLNSGSEISEDMLPIIYTAKSGKKESKEMQKNIRALAGRAEIREAGGGEIDLEKIVDELGSEGNIILVEGGPSLNGQLFERGLIDEVCLTLVPKVIGGDSSRILNSKTEIFESMQLTKILLGDEGVLFLRFLRKE